MRAKRSNGIAAELMGCDLPQEVPMSYSQLVNEVLSEIEGIHESLNNGNCLQAKAFFLDLEGDIRRLSEQDRAAASELLWYEQSSDDYSSDIYGYYWSSWERQFVLAF